jgi:hypothetical protein
MAGGEDQPQYVVLDVVVELDFVHGVFRFGELPADLSDLALEAGVPPHAIDVATARDGGQPGTRVAGHPRRRPLHQRGDEGVLREVLGQADVADRAGESSDEPCRLDPPDRLDGPLRRLASQRRLLGPLLCGLLAQPALGVDDLLRYLPLEVARSFDIRSKGRARRLETSWPCPAPPVAPDRSRSS